MKRWLRRLGILLLVLVGTPLVLVLAYLSMNWEHARRFPKIISAYYAKEACTCRFVLERDEAALGEANVAESRAQVAASRVTLAARLRWVDERHHPERGRVAEERARRRHAEMLGRGVDVTYDAVLADIHARDARDTGRADAPLLQAPDALLLDNSDMGIDDAIAAAIAFVEQRALARG